MAESPKEHVLDKYLCLVGDVRYRMDAAGRIMEVSGAHEDLLGYSSEALEGAHYLVLLDSSARNDAYRFYSEQAKQGTEQTDREFPAVTRRGQTIQVRQIVRLITEAGTVRGYDVVLRDVSDRHRASQERAEATGHLQLLGSIHSDERVESLLERAARVLDADRCVLGYVSESECRVSLTYPDDIDPHQGKRIPLGEAFAGLVAAEAGVVALADRAHSDHAFHPLSEWEEAEACIGAPIFTGDTVTGTVCFFRKEAVKGGFSPLQREFVTLFAGMLGRRLDEHHLRSTQSVALERLDQSWALATDGLVAVDSLGNILSANEAFRTMLGLTREPVGKDIRLYLPRVFDRKSGATEAMRPDGSLLQVDMARSSEENGEVVVRLVPTRERDRHRRLALRKEATIQALLASAPGPAGVLVQRDGRLTHLSANAAAQSFFDLLSPGASSSLSGAIPDSAQWEEACGQCMATDEPVEFVVSRNGNTLRVTLSRVDAEQTTTPVFTYLSADITGHVASRQSLGRVDAEYRALKTLTEGAVLLTTPDGRVESAAGAFTRMFGYDTSGVAGLPVRMLGPERLAPGPMDVTVRHLDGSEFETRWHSTVIEDGSGRTISLIQDISHHIARNQEAQWKAGGLDALPEAVLLADANRRVVYQNSAGRELFGEHLELSQLLSQLEHGGQALQADHLKEMFYGRCGLRQDAGVVRVLALDWRPVAGPDGVAGGGLLVARDVGNEVALEEQLRAAGTTDPVTGLPNRSATLEALTPGVGVLLVEVSEFGALNHRLGWSEGDAVLRAVAERMQGLLQTGEWVARVGADSFLMVCPGRETEFEMRSLAEKVVDALGQPVELNGHRHRIQAFIGAVAPGVCGSADLVLVCAEKSLAEARQEGTGHVTFYRSSLGAERSGRARHLEALKKAVEEEALEVWYEPLVNLSDGSLNGFRAEAYWIHPEYGLSPVAPTLTLVPNSGIGSVVAAWTCGTAAAQLSYWQGAYGRHDLVMWVDLDFPEGAQHAREALGDARRATELAPDRLRLWSADAREIRNENDLEEARASGTGMGHGPFFSAARDASQSEKLFLNPVWAMYWTDRGARHRATVSPISGIDIRS